jgi:hypothetical protein
VVLLRAAGWIVSAALDFVPHEVRPAPLIQPTSGVLERVFAEVATELELELADNVELFNRADTRPHADRAQYDVFRVWRQLDVSAVTERIREFLLGFVAALARSLPADMQEQLDARLRSIANDCRLVWMVTVSMRASLWA